ncbi:MAG TPA: hypothetical protein VGP50_16735 [Stellaceae bacterium]|nr:hypothetical protein [Stellaceae bacterium]
MDPDARQPSDPAAAPSTQLVLELYKAYLTDLGNIGSRYTTYNGFYVSIVSGLLAVLALTKRGEALEKFDTLLYLVIPIFAGLLCLVWRETMTFHSALFRTKFDVLREMEEYLPFKAYTREEKLRRPGRRLIKNDELIPVILALPFAVVFIFGLWKLLQR